MEHGRSSPSLPDCIRAVHLKIANQQFLQAAHSKPHKIKGSIAVVHNDGHSGPGNSAFLQIYSATEIDPNTRQGKLSKKAYLKRGRSMKHDGGKTTTYHIKLHVEPNFGIPGAFLITNEHKREFFLESATLEVTSQIIHFDCRSWVYPLKMTKAARLFFSNSSYLPNETPFALEELRKSELRSLRGDKTGEEWNKWDRIYDYDLYSDLDHTDRGQRNVRPVLGGSQLYPYPRRGKTGQPPTKTDPSAERNLEIFTLDTHVPPDEQFSPRKLSEFISNSIQASAYFLIPEVISIFKKDSRGFESFDEIRDLYSCKRSRAIEEKVRQKLKQILPHSLFKEIMHVGEKEPIKFPLPQIIADNDLAWRNDEEFGRQMLAGTNPTRIQCLQKFPPAGKNGMSTIRESHIEHALDGLTPTQAIYEWRIFILDHHDYLMPFLSRINNKTGVCAYASRTLLFLRSDGTLKPLVIELSLPGPSKDKETSRVFLPASQGTEAALWQLAKAHVAANDSAYHHLISHWLHTHAVVEPFIIATRRQLSVMHPVHRLLDPHFKDTMHINALARRILINSGGILEKTLFTGEISMELSSELYKEWRFDEQALPVDLLKRRMALEDPDPENLAGVQLLFQDYPYGADGLEIWAAIKKWVRDYCSIFYKQDDSVRNDTEIQAWWTEIRNVGHGDKRNETWWYKMTTLAELIEALTTLIWIASALHASVNFGQYAYAGYPPNRPTRCRSFVPKEGTQEFAQFLRDPDMYYLNMLPDRFEMALGIALVEVLSRHTSDEMHLGQRSSEWIDNTEVRQLFDKFKEELQEIEIKIFQRNRNPMFKNRRGPARIPYNLLRADNYNVGSKAGMTGKGIPNSISI